MKTTNSKEEIGISIVTCTFNSEKYLPEMLQSIAVQTVKSFEHIFVDGNSTDSTLELINQYSKNENFQVHLFRRDPIGISDAMNFGLSLAKGDYVLFLHGDDKLHDSVAIENILRETKDSNVAWHTWRCAYINENSEVTGISPLVSYSSHKLHKLNFISHPSTIVSRSTLCDVGGFDTKLKFAMDYDLWLRLSSTIEPSVHSEVISQFRQHDAGLSTMKAKQTMREDLIVRLKYCERWPQKLVATLRFFIIEYILKTPIVGPFLIKARKSTKS